MVIVIYDHLGLGRRSSLVENPSRLDEVHHTCRCIPHLPRSDMTHLRGSGADLVQDRAAHHLYRDPCAWFYPANLDVVAWLETWNSLAVPYGS